MSRDLAVDNSTKVGAQVVLGGSRTSRTVNRQVARGYHLPHAPPPRVKKTLRNPQVLCKAKQLTVNVNANISSVLVEK